MFRKLIVILITWFVFYSAQTSALGLGSIELNSGLNQPFDATIKLVARNEAEHATRHLAFADQRVGDELNLVARNGETDPGARAGRAVNQRVHSDHAPVDVDERSTRVAHVDRRVGLNEVGVVTR